MYKSSCVLTLHAISHYSPDVLKGHAGLALPLAFLGMHQLPGPDEEQGESHDATLWSEVWQENVPGEEGGAAPWTGGGDGAGLQGFVKKSFVSLLGFLCM